MTRLAVGAYGTVYKCTLDNGKTELAIKLMEIPKSIHDRCVLHDIFTGKNSLNIFLFFVLNCRALTSILLLFKEIFILDSLRHNDSVCHLYPFLDCTNKPPPQKLSFFVLHYLIHALELRYDFGVSQDYYWVMMKCYKCSLKEWRLRQTKPLAHNLPLYCNIFQMILDVMKVCTEGSILLFAFLSIPFSFAILYIFSLNSIS